MAKSLKQYFRNAVEKVIQNEEKIIGISNIVLKTSNFGS